MYHDVGVIFLVLPRVNKKIGEAGDWLRLHRQIGDRTSKFKFALQVEAYFFNVEACFTVWYYEFNLLLI